MAASDAGAWARLRLVQGDSATSHWELGSEGNETRLTVGSNPSCQWVVNDPSVEPFHLVFRWDEAGLSVAGSRESVALTLDGQPVGTSFVRVGARARVEFGRCALVAETSASPSSRRKSAAPPSPGGPNAAHSSRPPKRTLMGVAALTDSTPPTRVPASSPAPAAGATSTSSSSGPTAIGLPPAPDRPVRTGSSPSVPASGQGRSSTGSDRPGASRAPGSPSERPGGSTLYGLGGLSGGLNVDVVSPSRLRRSSIPPGVDDPGRATEPGYPDGGQGHEKSGSARPTSGVGHAAAPQPAAYSRPGRADATPTDTRLIEDARQLRALSTAGASHRPPPDAPEPGGERHPEPSSSGPRPAMGPASARPAAVHAPAAASPPSSAGASGDDWSDEPPPRLDGAPPRFRPSGPMPAPRPSNWAIVVGVSVLLGLGVWVYLVVNL